MKLRWVVLALLLGALLWLALRSTRPEPSSSAASPQESSSPSGPELSAQRENPASTPENAASAAVQRPSNVRVTARRYGSELPVENATVVARRGAEVVESKAPGAEPHEFALAPGAWTIEATAEGLQLATRDVLAPASTSPALELELWLNPRGATLVRLAAADWRQLEQLAAALGLDPLSFFDTHFTLWWSSDGTEATRAPASDHGFDDAPDFSPWLRDREGGGSEIVWRLVHHQPRGTWLSGTLGTRSGPWTLVPQDANEFTLPLRFAPEEFEPPSVVLRVLDFAGAAPPPGATVALEALESRRGEREPVVVPRDGLVRFDALRPGEYMLVASAPERADVHRIVRARLGRQVDLGTLKLEPANGLEVLVTDSEGRPLPAFVSSVGFAAGELLPPTTGAREVHTDENGVARLAVGSGALVVRARITGPEALVPLTGHEAAPLLVREPRPGQRVELVVHRPAEVGIKGAYGRVAILDEQGLMLERTWKVGAAWGGYLQPGRYRALDVTLDGEVVTERPFEVRAGQELEFALH